MSDLLPFIQDAEVKASLLAELNRQRDKIELIASENFTSLAVMQAQGTWLTNKYAEGLPGKRYYGGCECVDEVETLAINRACQLFNAKYANVQPHSGANANNAVYFALTTPGDTIMGQSLSHGGHLTHGSPANISGKYYKVVPYFLNEDTEMLDYDEIERLAKEHKPKMIVAGASAYPRAIDFKRFSEIAKSVGAILFVDMAHIAGLVAAGLHQNPVDYADVVTSTTHKTLRGPRGGIILTNTEDIAKKINRAVFPGTQGGPLMHVIAAKAIIFGEALKPEYKLYQHQVIKNIQAIAQTLIKRGIKIVSGGTDNHLALLDLAPKGLTGKEVEEALDHVGITTNKNTVPKETQSPFVTSGIRLGSPAMTARGMKEPEMVIIATLIADVIDNLKDEAVLKRVASDVLALTRRFPLYPELG